jgi:hypothetical protein
MTENKVYNLDSNMIEGLFSKSLHTAKINLYGECFQKNHKTKHINQTGLIINNKNLPKTLILYLETNYDNPDSYVINSEPKINIFDYSIVLSLFFNLLAFYLLLILYLTIIYLIFLFNNVLNKIIYFCI